MSKYNDYGQFMSAVLKDADEKCKQTNQEGLTGWFKLTGVAANIISIMLHILSVSWAAFVSVGALMALAPIPFIAALSVFVVSPIGLLVIAALISFGGVDAIKHMYERKEIVVAILDIGKKYKPEFDKLNGNVESIDALIDKAANEILNIR